MTLTLFFSVGIAHGETLDLDAWSVFGFPLMPAIASIAVAGGNIQITLVDPIAVTTIGFSGPQPYFRAVNGAILRSFEALLPFP